MKVSVIYGPHSAYQEFYDVNEWYITSDSLVVVNDGRKTVFAKGYWNRLDESSSESARWEPKEGM